jgi:hypothetical protein
MAGDRAGCDLLATIGNCVAVVRDEANAAGVALDLIVPVNPALVRTDTTPLEDVGCCLLRYAVDQAQPGHRLRVCLDMAANNIVTLNIDEEAPKVGHGSIRSDIQAKNAPAAGIDSARKLLDASGGELLVSRGTQGWLHLLAKLPCPPSTSSSP